MTPNVITLSTLQNRMGLFQIQLLLPDPINEKSKKLLLFFFFFFFFLFFFFNILSSFNTSLSLSLSLSLSVTLGVSQVACLTQYPHLNKVTSASHKFLQAFTSMAHQESRPTSASPFEAAF